MNTIANRRYEFDWLRIGAILVVFLYHSTRFFNLGNWHIKNITTYVWVEAWIVFASSWLMPLFFVISGASLFFALGKARGWSKFFTDKILRLMVPVLFASVTHSALQIYLERLTHGQFTGSFLSFVPQYFHGVYMGIGAPGNFAWHGMHLWYLFFLFLYSIIFYRLFTWFKGSGQEVIGRIMAFSARPGTMYIWFSLPLILLKVLIPGAVLNVGSGGWGFLYYIWFLIAGFMIVSDNNFQQRIQSQRRLSLSLGVVLSIAYLSQLFGLTGVTLPGGANDWVISGLCFLSAWSWIFTFLGFGMRHLSFERPMLQSVNEGVLPVFILHQTVLLAVGFFIMQSNLHDLLKWALNSTISFVVIIAIYLLLVRKYDGLRFLFGMKTTRPFFQFFQLKAALAGLLVVFCGLFVFAAANPFARGGLISAPMPLTFNPETDIVLTCKAITNQSTSGVRVIAEQEAFNNQAIELQSGANQQIEPRPAVYFEMNFTAPAGQYFIWIRGKTDLDNGYTDSAWLQIDDQIGTRKGVRVGNWLDVHPAGVYGWAGDTDDPVALKLMQSGEHRIRIQPRQTPHRIDQIWFSRAQYSIPDTNQPIQ